tara:strand:+ start:6916 stop:9243 length:2328 start_codon:yes stop_codon:yes gene_type:complete
MASLIWENVGFISSTSNAKFRVKMNDGTSMAESDEGIAFINLMNGSGSVSINNFKYSLGFGQKNYNYDTFFSAASLNDDMASLGDGIGVVSESFEHKMPYYNSLDFGVANIINLNWEVDDYSAIVTIGFQSLNQWSETINASEGYDNVFNYDYYNNLGIEFGDAPFVNTDANQGSPDYITRIPVEDISEYNILVSFSIKFRDFQNTFRYIECANSEEITNAVSGSTRYAFAPINFTDSLYNFNVSILNLNSPEFVNEGESAPIFLQVKSADYNGQIQVFLVDNESLLSVNEAIGSELSDWYGEIGEDVVAQYGTLEYNGQKIFQDSITAGETKEYNINYTAESVNAGQTDNMSIFIKYATEDLTDFTPYAEDEEDVITQWNLLSISDYFTYSDSISIPILDIHEEYIEEYEPSNNVITQPSDIIHHILGEELGYDKNNVDTFSKADSRQSHSNWQLGFSINKEIDSKKLMQEISQSCKSIPTLNSDKLKFITINNTYDGYGQSTISAEDVLKYQFTRTSIDDIKTQVEVKYEKDYGLDTYLSSTDELKADPSSYLITGTYSDYIADNIETNNYYGVKYDESSNEIDHIDTFLTFESDYIRNDFTALELAKYLLQWNLNQHNVVSLTLPLKYYGFEVGDLIEFDKMILGKKVYNESYVLDNPNDMPIRCGQFILPLFMITETRKSINTIQIKAIQLHHMSDSILSWKGQDYNLPKNILGDVNRDGELNIHDIIVLVQHIVGGTQLTGTSLQNADYDGDGFVNVLDLLKMIETILDE